MEDDVVAARSLEVLLGRSGFEVTVASTINRAISLLPGNFELMLIDLMLPDGDGADLLRQIRSANWPIWIAVVTGVSDPKRLGDLVQYAPQLIVRKPIDFQSLLTALRDPGH